MGNVVTVGGNATGAFGGFGFFVVRAAELIGVSVWVRSIITAQCPTYLAYSVRALSGSLVPLMIARPSGNTVNS